MRTIHSGNKLISFTKGLVVVALSAFAGNAMAEYYVVYAPPAVYVEKPVRPPCVVKYVKPHCYAKKHYKKTTKRYKCQPCYKKSSCDIAVYYSSCCGPCGTAMAPGPTVIASPTLEVRYGATPVYRPNTYHPTVEYEIAPSMDMRTADDIFF